MKPQSIGKERFPLSPFERGMYLEQKLDPDSVMYTLLLFYDVEGVSAERLKEAFGEMFRAHEAFRSVYREDENGIYRVLTDELPAIEIERVDSLDCVRQRAQSLYQPFDLGQGIPARAVIYTDGVSCTAAFACHHILFDISSNIAFSRELFARLCGEGITAERDLSDIDAESAEQVYDRGFALYEKMYEGGVPVTELPLKGARPKVHPLSDVNRETVIVGEQLARLRAIAKEQGVSVFSLLLAALSATVGKYTGAEDVVIGVPVNTRAPEDRDMIGMFVNTAPIRLSPVRGKSCADYLTEVSGAVRTYLKDVICPFDRLTAAFLKNRDASRNALFDVGLNYYYLPKEYRQGEVRLASELQLQPSGKDLNYIAQVGEDRITLIAQYSSGLFDDALVGRFTEQLIGTALQFYDGCVGGALQLPAEQEELLMRYAVSAQDEVPFELMHRMFEHQAAETPDRTAIIARDGSFTFDALNRRMNVIAHNLIDRGIGRGDSVVLLLPRRAAFFMAQFGVLKAGAAYIPCDPEYPAERIRHIIDDSGAAFIITTSDLIADYPAEKAMDIDDLMTGNNEENPEVGVTGDDLAYMIYTSGSTGKPKGVMLTHRGICNYFYPHPANTLFHTAKQICERVVGVTTVSFDMMLKEAVGFFINGRTLVFADEEQMNDPRALAELMRENKVDAINATPSRLQQYMEYPPFREALRDCTLVMSGGEGYPAALLDGLRKATGAVIFNTYGPTEITVSSNMADITHADRITIGRPLLNYVEYIVDPFGELCPPGAVGELYIGGPGVSKGYKNLPDKTAAAFVEYKGQRMYRSGDYAKWDENGNAVVLGRMDSQVKLRGLRIELSEIEELMALQDGVKKAVVAVKKLSGQDQLCAYYTSDEPLDEAALRDALSRKLTKYMVPATFTRLDKIPVTANGKTDMKALPEPALPEQTVTLPQTELQRQIFDIVAQVIGRDDFGIETELYAAGLTSLNSVSLCIKLSDAFGVNVQIRDFTDNDTVEKLERFIGAQDGAEEFARLDAYPLTKTQEGVFFETQAHADSTTYNLPTLIGLDNSVDTAKLKAAFAAAVEAHPYMKTRLFISDSGTICQKRDDAPFTAADVEELRCGSIDEVKDGLAKPFDLLGGRLFRAAVILSDEKNYLFFDVHHVVFDGESKKILMRDISRAYAGDLLTPEKFSGYEAAQAEERLRGGAHFDASKKYYTDLLDGVDGDCLPIGDVIDGEDRDDLPVSVTIGGREGLHKEVLAYCKAHSVTPNAFYTAAFGWLLGKYCGGDEAVFATINNGRNDPRFQQSVSMFVRTYPVLCRAGDPDTAAYIAQVGRQLTDSLRYDVYSFAEISRDLGVNADVIFAYQSTISAADAFEFCGAEAENIPVSYEEAKAKLELLLYPDGDRLVFRCSFMENIYTEGFIRRFVNALELAAAGFVRCEKPADIDLIDDDTAALLERFNDNAADYEKTDIVSQFRNQAQAHPDHTAVIYKDKRFSYAETDRISEKIGAYLVSKGIGREMVVSVLIPRCEYMVFASLGVLKAGAAYQPLDPSYPPERLEFMIEDAQAALLIADRDLMECVPNYQGEVLYLDEIPALPDAQPIAAHPDLHDRFILLYTSGSTGTPKGVILEHGNLAAFCAWYRRFFELGTESCAAAYASYGFDADMMDLYPALTSGASVLIIEDEIRLDLPAIQRCFDENRVTHSFMTTQVGRQFASFYTGSTLKHLSVGGEKLVPVFPQGKSFRFYNVYGPTECTVFITLHPVDKTYKRVPIGGALNNLHLYVVDKNGKMLPPDIPGELWVAGPQVGRGYLNRPEKTAEVFVDNPFADDPDHARAYRTGDIVRYRSDGTIDFVGRNDGQVKVRGFRIELTEVEEIIRQFEGITDATVQAFDAPAGGKFIAAYVVSDKPVDVKALNAFIAANKPPYMVPAATMQLDRIPLNQNQKVNKRALPAPVMNDDAAQQEEECAARPMTRFEEEIAAVLKKTLGEMEMSPTVPLTQYGLTSISAIGLVATLMNRFNVEIPVTVLLDGASIVDIENTIFEEWMKRGFKSETEPSAEQTGEIADAYPLSSVQLAVYYDAMKREADIIYNIPLCFSFDHIDASRLADAVKAAVRAHTYLNTHTEIRSGNLVQVRDDQREPQVEQIRMSDDALKDFMSNFIRPFDLSESPLYRFAVVVTDSKTYLFTDIHHLIFDGFSSGVLLMDIGRAYRGEELTPERYTCFDYAAEDDRLRHSEAYDEAAAYYDKLFERFEESTEIPADKSDSADNGLIAEAFCPVSKQAVDAFCREQGVTPSTLFLAATFLTVSRFAGTRDVYLSTISSGREQVKVQNTIGMFVHTLPLGMHFEKGMTVGELLAASHGVMRGGIDHSGYPFAEIAAKYGYTTQIMYECQIGVLLGQGELGGVPYQNVRMTLEAPKFKTVFAIIEHDGDYGVMVRYNDALYTAGYMQTLAECVKVGVLSLIADTGRDVTGISLLTDDEEKLIKGFETSQIAQTPILLLHKMLEHQASLHPDRTALIACDRRMTYREFDREVNIVSHNLIDRGVKARDKVSLLLPRRSYFFTAMFAALKAGAAFIPCDPAYPADRINHIISDSDARFIITTKDRLADYPADRALDIEDLLTGNDDTAPETDVTPSDLAYLIYTSGSTGKPKGVMLRHEGICNFLTPHSENVLFANMERVTEVFLSVTTISFDMSLKETAGSLCNGKTLVFAGEDELNDPRALTKLLIDTKADTMNATPSRLLQYIEYKPFAEAIAQLKLVLSGGEMYPIRLRDKLRGLTKAIILNTYGPTEVTVSSNIADITDAPYISVGRPLPNYREYIVDADGNLLPHGVTGELYIGGPGVAEGYRNLPEATAQRFVDYCGVRVYKSGDYAKWDKDGNVIILGRMDGQVKLRGLRIELGEIEGLMEQQPHIQRAVAAVRKLGGQDNLCAWFTADETIDVYELREALAKKLTHYMIPAAMMQVDAIPMTPNGKTNLKALPEPVMLESGEYEAPQNELERYFCELFEKILGIERVGVNDDFFSIGGTSLAVTSVMIEATENGYTLTYGDVFKYTTPRALAAKFTGVSTANAPTLSAAQFDRYDYTKINEMLARNTLDAFRAGERREIGNILLTGATGYMGIHVLAAYLRTQTGTVWCLVRKGRYDSALKRVQAMLFYYFDKEFANVGDRLQAINGDVTDYEYFRSIEDLPIDTVFNCAASVKHFSSGTDIEDVNVGGVKNCIRYCETKGIRLIHFSTTSVAGAMPAGTEEEHFLDERSLYFGQLLDNQYTSSKTLAERELFEHAAEGTLDGKVIRVGTLSPRESDGEFQANFLSNSFMGRLRSYALLKCFPYSMMDNVVRMGPIDVSADAFLRLATTPDDCRLFNAVNTHSIPTVDVIRTMRELGIEVETVEDDRFAAALEEAEKDPKKAAILASMLAYKGMNGVASVPVKVKYEYTAQVLARLGFYWNDTDSDYIRKFIEALNGLCFFDENNLMR